MIWFAAAKLRATPLKTLSMPRLGLTAAILDLRLGGEVSKTLNITNTDVTFWPDSMKVL